MSSSGNSTSGVEHLRQRGWVSLRQFADIAGVSYVTAMKMRKRGQVNAIRVGGTWRVYTTEVRRFLKEGNADDPSKHEEQLAAETGRNLPRMSVEGEGDPTLSPFHNPHLTKEQEDE